MKRKIRKTKIIVPGEECRECIRRRCLEMPVIKEMSEGCGVTMMTMHGSAGYLTMMTRVIRRYLLDMAAEWSERDEYVKVMSEYFDDIEQVLMIYANLRNTDE